MIALISAAQDLTASWVDLGDPVPMSDWNRCALWANLDINNTNDARVRAIAKLTDTVGAGEYTLPIKVVTSSDVKVEGEYIEFNVDADQKMVLEVETKGLVPFIQFQVQAGTVGATAGQFDSAIVTQSNY